MDGYPNEAIEAIIRDELLEGKATGKWTAPRARKRCGELVAEHVIRRRERDDVLQQFRRVFEARYQLAPYLANKECIFAFPYHVRENLYRVLDAVEDALVAVRVREALWPADAIVSHEQAAAYIGDCMDGIVQSRAGAAASFAKERSVGLHSDYVHQFDLALDACLAVMMTGDEGRLFGEWFNRALDSLRQFGLLVDMPDDMTRQ